MKSLQRNIQKFGQRKRNRREKYEKIIIYNFLTCACIRREQRQAQAEEKKASEEKNVTAQEEKKAADEQRIREAALEQRRQEEALARKVAEALDQSMKDFNKVLTAYKVKTDVLNIVKIYDHWHALMHQYIDTLKRKPQAGDLLEHIKTLEAVLIAIQEYVFKLQKEEQDIIVTRETVETIRLLLQRVQVVFSLQKQEELKALRERLERRAQEEKSSLEQTIIKLEESSQRNQAEIEQRERQLNENWSKLPGWLRAISESGVPVNK
jgi:hypothetical protein